MVNNKLNKQKMMQIEAVSKRRSTSKPLKMTELFRKMFLNALKSHSKEQYVRSHYKDGKL